MRIVIVHTNDQSATALVAESRDVTENALASVLRISLASTVVGHIAILALFKFHVVFRLAHLLELWYGVFVHYCLESVVLS